MPAGNVRDVTDAADLYDLDLVSKTEVCELCAAPMVYGAGGHFYCSNDKCESHHIKIDC